MVKTVIDGHEKLFYTKCLSCATEFTYQLSDVQTERTGDAIFEEIKTVKCPVCGESESAMLLTKEEYENMFMNYPYSGYYGRCAV